MSIFDNIKAAEHTFAAWCAKEWAIVFNVVPKVESVLASTLKYAGPALETVIAAEAGAPAAAIVGKVIQDAQAGLTAASGLVYDFGAIPSVGGVINSIQANLSSLLSAGHVTNANSVATVTRVVNELTAIASVIPTKTTPAA